MRSRFITSALVGVAIFPAVGAGTGAELVRLSNHMLSPQAISQAQHLGRVPASDSMTLAIALQVNDPAALAQAVEQLSTPGSPNYGHYLTPEEFTAQYSPSEQDFAEVVEYLNERGLTVTQTHSNRLVIDVRASASQIEQAFGLELHEYVLPDGRIEHATNAEPLISANLAGRINGILGLNSFAKRVTHVRERPANARPAEVGSAMDGGLIPSDLRTVYNLNGVTQTGAGQTLGLFELDGYTLSDITAYASAYGIPNPTSILQNVTIDGGPNPAVGSGAVEVTLDIEVMLAIAPGATKIIVYEGPNSDQGLEDTYNKIATDNLAKNISTSWGQSENESTQAVFNSETASYQQMAMQGQTIYAAAGDAGAFDDDSNNPGLLVTDDPASNPYMVGVGGTALAVNGGETYNTESAWGTGTQGGGGGISSIFLQPTYQAGLGTSANLAGNTTMRMVPDVSLDADPNTGYEIVFNGSHTVVGGTSCAAPMWAAFTALVNQARATENLPLLGFANPAIYALAGSSLYANDFHDVNNGSTNLHYPTVKGYDLATGWGSYNGANLLAGLSAAVLPTLPPTGMAAAPHNRVLSVSWPTTVGAATYTLARGISTSGPFTPLIVGTAALGFVDTGLQNGVKYYYVLSTTNTAGQSGNSPPLLGTPAAMAPEAPSGLAVTGVGTQ